MEFSEKFKDLFNALKNKSDEDNNKLTEQYDKIKENENFDSSINGAIKLNEVNNNVFYAMFDPEDAEDFEDIFETYANGSIGLDELVEKIKRQNYKMMNSIPPKCPLECMLYASQIINSKIEEDERIFDYFGDIISDVLETNKEILIRLEKDAIMHIVKNWNWQTQISILLIGLGYSQNCEWISDVINLINERTDKEVYRYALCKMIVLSGDSCFAERLLALTSNLENSLEDEKIWNLILKQQGYERVFEDIEVIENSLQSMKMSSTSKSLYRKIVDKMKEDGIVSQKDNNTELLELLDIANKEDGDEKENAMNQIFEKYFWKIKDIIKVFDTFSANRNSSCVPYIERLLVDENRKYGWETVARIYSNYQKFVVKNDFINFTNEVLNVHPEDEPAIRCALYLKQKDDENARKIVSDFLRNTDNPKMMEESVTLLCRFEKNFVGIMQDSLVEILKSFPSRKTEIYIGLRNYYGLIRKNCTALVQQLNNDDNLIKAIRSILEISIDRPDDSTISLIIKIVDSTSNSELVSEILMNIYNSLSISSRTKEDVRAILGKHKLEVPS